MKIYKVIRTQYSNGHTLLISSQPTPIYSTIERFFKTETGANAYMDELKKAIESLGLEMQVSIRLTEIQVEE